MLPVALSRPRSLVGCVVEVKAPSGSTGRLVEGGAWRCAPVERTEGGGAEDGEAESPPTPGTAQGV